MFKLHLNFFAKIVQSCCSMPKDKSCKYKSPSLALSNGHVLSHKIGAHFLSYRKKNARVNKVEQKSVTHVFLHPFFKGF